MEDQSVVKDSIFERLESYGKTSLELFKLKALDKSADVASNVVSTIVVAITLILFLICLNAGVAYWLGEILGKVYYGFFAVAGFWAVLSLGFYLFRKNLIKTPVNNAIISSSFQGLEEVNSDN